MFQKNFLPVWSLFITITDISLTIEFQKCQKDRVKRETTVQVSLKVRCTRAFKKIDKRPHLKNK